MSKRSTFRPTVQTLETRRCMAAAVLADAPVVQDTTVTGVAISGNTATQEGGGIVSYGKDAEEEKPAVTQGWGMAQYQYGFEGTYHDSAGNESEELKPSGNPATHAEKVDQVFADAGRDDANGDAVPQDSFSINFAKIETY